MTNETTAIILLAGGSSSRLGLPKQLFQYEGTSLLRRVALTALEAGSAELIVVLGYQADRIRRELDDLLLKIVFNTTWEEGIASSIRAGVGALPSKINAALFLVADQPLITATHLRDLAGACTTDRPVSGTAYSGTVGVPACFHRSLFPELLTLHGDTGAKSLLRKDPSRVAAIPFPAAGIDIDTMQDYQRLDRGLI